MLGTEKRSAQCEQEFNKRGGHLVSKGGGGGVNSARKRNK